MDIGIIKEGRRKKEERNRKNSFLNILQELGKSLQFPIAVLPFAAILSRFGQLGIDLLGVEGKETIGWWISFIIQKPGAVAFDNLALLFALGVAFGLAKDHRGEVTIASAIIFLIIISMTQEIGVPKLIYGKVLTFKAEVEIDNETKIVEFSKLLFVEVIKDEKVVNGKYVFNTGVLGGIVSGCFAAFLYNRLKNIELPQALAFFSGKRFVLMVAILTGLGLVFVFAILWPWLQLLLILMGKAVANPNNPAVAIPGTALYAFLNRLLIIFGLHQILNTFFWFQLPIIGYKVNSWTGEVSDYEKLTISGDIDAFAKGLSTSGVFQTGFFPVMMGGIPAIAIALIFASEKSRRKEMAGFYGGIAAVSFISGITEPIEFSFIFFSPLILLSTHAAITAIFVAITTATRMQIGFGFSAGFIDYAISFAQSWGLSKHNSGDDTLLRIFSNPLMIWPITLFAASTYYIVFYTLIKKLNIPTVGREKNIETTSSQEICESIETINNSKDTSLYNANVSKEAKDDSKFLKYEQKGLIFIEAIGRENIIDVSSCMTRIRLKVNDNSNINQDKIKANGAMGIKLLGTDSIQIIVGLEADKYSEAMRKILKK